MDYGDFNYCYAPPVSTSFAPPVNNYTSPVTGYAPVPSVNNYSPPTDSYSPPDDSCSPPATNATTANHPPAFNGLTEADLDFLKRMNMNDREVRSGKLLHYGTYVI